jgi:hypothetical protein
MLTPEREATNRISLIRLIPSLINSLIHSLASLKIAPLSAFPARGQPLSLA